MDLLDGWIGTCTATQQGDVLMQNKQESSLIASSEQRRKVEVTSTLLTTTSRVNHNHNSTKPLTGSIDDAASTTRNVEMT
eukprot:scaffold41_cov177-Alexandrium_tamarense.AAC.3